ncbi:hypothetical protein TSOC_012023 [Tetrabaena socialis]|uniref:Uncharacterized protein n=1 Tax=Tetrabaena socialis TaxID=47790 RepID=A0A2J7ZP66_9CHLO|nr:hypothetical protein TSOC_012023 [Tetrabaena socialis]|eukprot:PNH02063.1 hypothetical protein TSOC_012023 [Tetrabaena socialis]
MSTSTSHLRSCSQNALLSRGACTRPARPCTLARQRPDVRAEAFKLSSMTGGGAASRQQQTIAIDPRTASSSSPASQQRDGPPLHLIAVVVGVAGLVAMVVKKLRSGGLDANTYRYSANLHLADMMKDVNTVRIDDLTPDQIEAARARRSKERANHKLSLHDVELPQNHPFATKQVMSQEQHEQSLRNLTARSTRRRHMDSMPDSGSAGAAAAGQGRQR